VPRSLPRSLSEFLNATDPASREQAWEAFSRDYTRLILHTCHKAASGYDDAMDRYAFVLERLRVDEYRRLRTYDPARKASFTTWLVAVASRLCTDFHREKYGRARGLENVDGAVVDRQEVRSRLVDLVTEELNLERIPDGQGRSPDSEMLATEQSEVLHSALCDLDDRDQLLLAMRFEDGLTARDIANAMDFTSQFHVYRRLNVLLTGLRKSMEGKGLSGTES
jgi:RNA polymerase sigma factor (sigma-70 family)